MLKHLQGTMIEQGRPRPLTLTLPCRPQEEGQLESVRMILPQYLR